MKRWLLLLLLLNNGCVYSYVHSNDELEAKVEKVAIRCACSEEPVTTQTDNVKVVIHGYEGTNSSYISCPDCGSKDVWMNYVDRMFSPKYNFVCKKCACIWEMEIK